MSANTALVSPSSFFYDFLGSGPHNLGLKKVPHNTRISPRDTLQAMSKAPALIEPVKDLIALQAALTPDKDGELDLEFTGDMDHVELEALQGRKFYFQTDGDFTKSSNLVVVNKGKEQILSAKANTSLPWAEIHKQYRHYVTLQLTMQAYNVL
ncbi:MAG: hypothetical protein LW817_05930 [Candidatus Caenarcaniphilales bacterium]|jgi:hypothetical protein|nr:hypothetical protein [Candidatus Caenarcaniphilales bacterium]